MSLAPGFRRDTRFDDAKFRLGFARLVTHYWRHCAFLEDHQLLRDVHKLNGIPSILIHGRHDVSTPLETAWQLSQRWTTSDLRVVDAGHGSGDTFANAVIRACAQLARPTS